MTLWKKLPGAEGQERAEILLELAQDAINRSQGGEALALAEEAHQIYKSMGANAPNIDLANSIAGIGMSLKELNRVDEATKAIDGAIDLLREGCYPFVVDALRTKASWLADASRFEEAAATYLEIVQINEIDGEEHFVVHDLLSVTYCYQKLGRWVDVISHAERARELAKSNKMVDEAAWCDVYMADAYAELKSPEMALDIGKRAQNLARLRSNNHQLTKATIACGKAFVLQADFEKAEGSFQEARDIASGSKDWDTIAKIEREFINLYLVQGRVDAAAEIEERLKSLVEITE